MKMHETHETGKCWGEEWRRANAMKKHRRLLREAKPLVDNKPHGMSVALTLRKTQMSEDHLNMTRIMQENSRILSVISKHLRAWDGKIECFNRRKYANPSHMRWKLAAVDVLERQNYFTGCRLMQAQSSAVIHEGRKESRKYFRKLRKEANKVTVPKGTLRAYKTVVMPREMKMLPKLLRPKIYFDLAVKNIRPLGRVCIQLYTEACPDLVLHFVRMCTHNAMHDITFLRIFPHLWIEGELAVPDNQLSIPCRTYDMNILDHNSAPGIFSFAKRYLDGFPKGIVNFSISFKPMFVLNGHRLPFANVFEGLRVLDCLQDYGTKNGKPQKEIIIVKCGLIH